MVRFAPPTTVTGNRGATDELSVRRASDLLGLDSSASGGCFTDAELEHAYVRSVAAVDDGGRGQEPPAALEQQQQQQQRGVGRRMLGTGRVRTLRGGRWAQCTCVQWVC